MQDAEGTLKEAAGKDVAPRLSDYRRLVPPAHLTSGNFLIRFPTTTTPSARSSDRFSWRFPA